MEEPFIPDGLPCGESTYDVTDEYATEDYGFILAEIDYEELFGCYEDHGTGRQEWLEKRHKAEQQRLREIHNARQLALKQKWNI